MQMSTSVALCRTNMLRRFCIVALLQECEPRCPVAYVVYSDRFYVILCLYTVPRVPVAFLLPSLIPNRKFLDPGPYTNKPTLILKTVWRQSLKFEGTLGLSRNCVGR